jgi:mRNA interferase RelE/StbE
MAWKVVFTATAYSALKAVPDARVRALIFERVSGLEHDPELQGKPMRGPLEGLRSLRAVGQRWRVLYRIEHSQVIVTVVALGMRKEGDKRDIYALAQKLMKKGLL